MVVCGLCPQRARRHEGYVFLKKGDGVRAAACKCSRPNLFLCGMLVRMNHHAYLVTGDIEEGIEAALGEASRVLGEDTAGNPDVVVLRYGLFSVEDARMFQDAVMRAPVRGTQKVVIVCATRFFHEAQNALLKTFEEPPQGTFLVLVLPSEGMVLPTLRSRLVSLPDTKARALPPITHDFLEAGKEGREKMVAKLLERTKSDNDEEKATARADALSLVEGLTMVAYAAHRKAPSPELAAFLSDLDAFTPLLHDRSGPLKLMFEHLLIVTPKGLT